MGKGVQARLPGTLPAPAMAREGFRRAHESWKLAARVLHETSEAAKAAAKVLKKARAVSVDDGDEYDSASDDAEPVMRRRLLEADVAVLAAEEMDKNARASRREAKKAEGEAWARRQSRLADLKAIERGER